MAAVEDIVAALQPGSGSQQMASLVQGARDQLATQPARLAGIPAAEVAPEDVRNPAVQRVMDVLAAPRHVAEHIMGGLATLPQRAIENSQYSLDSGNYDPRVPVEAAMLPMGTGAIVGVPLNLGEEALGAGIRTYRNVPDTLMGYRKSGPQKGFEETNYPYTQDVAVTLPRLDGSAPETFSDAIKGMNADHALERAHRNWPDALHITPIVRKSEAGQ